jgi:hypothetical protein
MPYYHGYGQPAEYIHEWKFREEPVIEPLLKEVHKIFDVNEYIGSKTAKDFNTWVLHNLKKRCRKEPNAVEIFLFLVSRGTTPMKVGR